MEPPLERRSLAFAAPNSLSVSAPDWCSAWSFSSSATSEPGIRHSHAGTNDQLHSPIVDPAFPALFFLGPEEIEMSSAKLEKWKNPLFSSFTPRSLAPPFEMAANKYKPQTPAGI